MTSETEGYDIVDGATRVWHLPDASGRPLCDAKIGQPQHKYLPRAIPSNETGCSNCQTLHELPDVTRVRILEELGKYKSAGPLQRVDAQPAESGQNVVLACAGGNVVAVIFIPGADVRPHKKGADHGYH